MKRERLSYEEAVHYLYGLQKYGIKFGLSKTSNLLKALGSPHSGRKYIHIAGTNGKGSTAAMVQSILIRSGLKVGLYISPHLVRFTERFRVNHEEISQKEAAVLVEEIREVIHPEEPPTFFEFTTAMALLYFARKRTDIAIMEVGMGGRLDATNVIRPMVSVITNISLEHQEFLGNRLIQIAGEKAGIIKRRTDLVTAATQPSVLSLFEVLCREKKAPFWRLGREMHYRRRGGLLSYYGIHRKLRDLELGLLGKYQFRNAALVLALLEVLEGKGIRVTDEMIREGLKQASWPGRMHRVSRHPDIILDGAHNPAGIRTLADSIRDGVQYQRLILVLGVMADKDIQKITAGIVPIADYVIYTRPEYYRAATPETLMRAAAPLRKPGEVVTFLPQALERAKELADPEDLILITGSLFTVGEAMACLDPERYRPDEIR